MWVERGSYPIQVSLKSGIRQGRISLYRLTEPEMHSTQVTEKPSFVNENERQCLNLSYFNADNWWFYSDLCKMSL